MDTEVLKQSIGILLSRGYIIFYGLNVMFNVPGDGKCGIYAAFFAMYCQLAQCGNITSNTKFFMPKSCEEASEIVLNHAETMLLSNRIDSGNIAKDIFEAELNLLKQMLSGDKEVNTIGHDFISWVFADIMSLHYNLEANFIGHDGEVKLHCSGAHFQVLMTQEIYNSLLELEDNNCLDGFGSFICSFTEYFRGKQTVNITNLLETKNELEKSQETLKLSTIQLEELKKIKNVTSEQNIVRIYVMISSLSDVGHVVHAKHLEKSIANINTLRSCIDAIIANMCENIQCNEQLLEEISSRMQPINSIFTEELASVKSKAVSATKATGVSAAGSAAISRENARMSSKPPRSSLKAPCKKKMDEDKNDKIREMTIVSICTFNQRERELKKELDAAKKILSDTKNAKLSWRDRDLQEGLIASALTSVEQINNSINENTKQLNKAREKLKPLLV